MSNTLKQVLFIWPNTKAEQWRKINDAWVHQDAQIGEKAEIKGGTIRGGTIRGGTIWGGTIRGGTIWGGTWRHSPLQIEGTVFACCHAGPGLAGIGCEVHPIEKWFSGGFAPQIARKNEADFAALEPEYRVYLELIRQRDAALFPRTAAVTTTPNTGTDGAQGGWWAKRCRACKSRPRQSTTS